MISVVSVDIILFADDLHACRFRGHVAVGAVSVILFAYQIIMQDVYYLR